MLRGVNPAGCARNLDAPMNSAIVVRKMTDGCRVFLYLRFEQKETYAEVVAV